jgi:valyl-tRNA synthetase
VIQISLDTTACVVAPFMPFVAEALHQWPGARDSVHLADWPAARADWHAWNRL